nr:hypothetical protein [Mesorhizobium sp.]
MRNWFAFSRQAKGLAAAEADLALAVRRLFQGNGSKADADMLLVHLTDKAGFFRRPNYAEWIASTRSPAGYELHCALCTARAEVVQTILDFLALDDEKMIELQKAAQLEGQA